MRVAVVANPKKSLGGGLLEFRRALGRAGIEDPLWHEVPKSKKAPAAVKRALADGAELVFAWGGDGLVQRCVDVLAGSDVPLAVVPAGTTNLLASNLQLPRDIEQAIAVGLHGERRPIDVGRINGERFAVMAAVGVAAAMTRDAKRSLKDRFGRAAYAWAALKNLGSEPFDADVKVDGVTWFEGQATTILFANLGGLFGGITVFEDARPDNGTLQVGVVTAEGLAQWTRTAARAVLGTAESSPFVQATSAESVKATLSRKVVYELDGGDRKKTDAIKVTAEPAAVTVCVPPRS